MHNASCSAVLTACATLAKDELVGIQMYPFQFIYVK